MSTTEQDERTKGLTKAQAEVLALLMDGLIATRNYNRTGYRIGGRAFPDVTFNELKKRKLVMNGEEYGEYIYAPPGEVDRLADESRRENERRERDRKADAARAMDAVVAAVTAAVQSGDREALESLLRDIASQGIEFSTAATLGGQS